MKQTSMWRGINALYWRDMKFATDIILHNEILMETQLPCLEGWGGGGCSIIMFHTLKIMHFKKRISKIHQLIQKLERKEA